MSKADLPTLLATEHDMIRTMEVVGEQALQAARQITQGDANSAGLWRHIRMCREQTTDCLYVLELIEQRKKTLKS